MSGPYFFAGGGGSVSAVTSVAGRTGAVVITSADLADFNEAAQDAIGGALANSARVALTYADATPSFTADLVADSITAGYLHASATSRLFGRVTAAAGPGEEIPLGAGLAFVAGALASTITQYTDALARTAIGGLNADFPATLYADIPTAIAAAYAAGGGDVVVSSDTNVSAKLVLKDNVYLRLKPGVTLTWTGGAAGVVIGTATNAVTLNCGVVGYGAYIDMGTTAVKGFEVVSNWKSAYQGVTFLGTNAAAFMLDIRGDASAGTNPIGGRHTAYCLFTDLLHQGTCGTVMRLHGVNTNSGYVTLNTINNIGGEFCAVRGLDFSQWCDSNSFGGCLRFNLSANNSIGVEYNSNDPTNDVGVYNNVIQHVNVDTFAGPTGRIAVKINRAKDTVIEKLFNVPLAEGGLIVTTASTGPYRISEYDDVNSRILVHTLGEVRQGRFVISDAFTGLTNTDAPFVLESTDAGANGPTLVTYHNSASPAAADTLARWRVYGKDSGGNATLYGAALLVLDDPTDTSEDAHWALNTVIAGTSAARFNVGAGVWTTGVTGTDKGTNTGNFGTLYENNHRAATRDQDNQFSVVQTVKLAAAGNMLVLECDDAGAFGGTLAAYHNSASPAAFDVPFTMSVVGRNSTPVDFTYGQFSFTLVDPTAASEDGRWNWATVIAGSLSTRFFVGAGLFVGAGTTGGDQGDGTMNAASYYANGNLAIDSNALLRTRAFTIGTLPSASGRAGAIAYVTDSLAAPVYNATLTAGGSTFAKVVSDGTVWRCG